MRILAARRHTAFTTNRHERMHDHMDLGHQALGLRDLHAAELGAPVVNVESLEPAVRNNSLD